MAISEQSRFVKDFYNGRIKIADKIKGSTDKVLDAIDLDSMLTNPSEYLKLLGEEWLKTQQGQFKKAFKVGRKHGKEIVKEFNGKD